MSIILFLALVGTLYLMEHYRRQGKAVAAHLGSTRRTPVPDMEAEQLSSERPLDSRHAERRQQGERRHAA